MKIVLITIHRVTNYGAVLQAFATKLVLARFGETNIVDYENPHIDGHMALLRFDFSAHGHKKLVHDVLNFRNRLTMLRKFNHFIDTRLSLTQKICNERMAKEKLSDYDVYVCGSDQIWNPKVVNAEGIIDPMYFLSFAKNGSKKISYASSIGHHQFDSEEKTVVGNLLSDFSNLSVRESDGQQKIIEILPKKKVSHVVDPTLLLTKEEWLEEFNVNVLKSQEKYILVYSVPRTILLRKAVEYFSKKLKLKVVSIDKMFFSMDNVDRHVNQAGPKEFIELFANASFVITDSFHGTCFAINFGKPFVAISANERANRQISLLNLLGIEERLMFEVEDFERIQFDLDYSKGINDKLNTIRMQSINYLEIALDN